MNKEKLITEYEQVKKKYWEVFEVLKEWKNLESEYPRRLCEMQLHTIAMYAKILESIAKELKIEIGFSMDWIDPDGRMVFSFAGPEIVNK